MDIIMLCGAGGTGKSTVCVELEKSGRCTIMKSSSRTTYARLGISTETAAFSMSIEEQKNLQDEIMKDHINKLLEYARIARQENKILVVDRSPFDHMTYWVRTNALDQMSANWDFSYRVKSIEDALESLDAQLVGWFDFEYPTPWPTADAMRDQNEIKTFEMSLMTSGMIRRYARVPEASNFYRTISIGTPENRAYQILTPFTPPFREI